MKRWLCGTLALGTLALAVSAATAATNKGLITWSDKADHYRITLPSSWVLIPRSKAAIDKLITELRAKKTAEDNDLALTFSSILASPEGVSELTTFRLQAFPWPPPDLKTTILTEVSLRVTRATITDAPASLAALGAQYAAAFEQNAGAKIDRPKLVHLPEGTAEYIQGTIPVGGGIANGVELYLIPHGSRLYDLSFTIDSRLMAKATIFAEIAEHLTFT